MKDKKIHFMGVGGAGCSAAFAIASSQGFQVTGCDIEETSPYLDKRLKKFVSIGHDPAHLKNSEVIIYSPAVTTFDPNNEELMAAKRKGLDTIPWEEFVAKELLKDKFTIAVAGTHGKGTVTAMVGVILEKADLDPTCLVGAIVADWKTNYRVGKSKYFVIEADEYSEKLLRFDPDIAAITNIEFDHPEYFRDIDDLKKTFNKFVKKLKKDSILVLGPGVTFENPNGKTKMVKGPVGFDLKMIGEFNKTNAAIAAGVARELGVSEGVIEKSLKNFNGLRRRFEFKGEEKRVLVFDDYAHHPTAISETLRAVREKFPDKKIWLIFQPHLFSRTRVLFDDFVSALENAPVEKVVLVDIFAAREKDTGEVSSADLAKAVENDKTKYIGSLEDAATYVVKEVAAGDVVITMGAGDIYKLPERILEKLKGKG